MRLSVVMSVYNDAPFVERAVTSILRQSWSGFEFIIINDGCTDGSTDILRRLATADPRIRLVEQENRGLVASLNRGFAMATGDLVARMDGDDESLPHRFERQLAFLDKHPDHGVIGAQTINIDATGKVVGLFDAYPRTDEAFRAAMESDMLINHPSAIIDRAAFEKVGGYRPLYRHCEDYDLWLRLSEVTKLCSVEDFLHRYRLDPGQVTKRHLLPMEIGAAVAWEAHRERQAGRPDPTTALGELPSVRQLGDLDRLFGKSGVARRVRERVVPKVLWSQPALTSGGADLLCQHVADGGDRHALPRVVPRLLRFGEYRGAARLAASLSRSRRTRVDG
ncbi:Glycosyl transferase family 2 [Sphingomonas gellani]|uniref:Glycosyl transferase family 2 n=1 Tax=Sphingomonas gellani TaxID=1166340 RepID=A0A1H7YJR6_9SPHN|nr:glycosyltransferase [Sphingomonas gellani]SEM45568.1 Glycosyl transferase family 2 [Sphingomonas gellani]